jgi:hypothetical protein
MSYDPPSITQNVDTSKTNVKNATNATGSTVPKTTPVKVTISGIGLIDVSQETDIDSLAGLLKENLADASSGDIVTSGIIENISGGYSVGSLLYISKTGGLTSSKPAIGVASFVAGDFVVKVGVVAKNSSNPLNIDLIVRIEVLGQL